MYLKDLMNLATRKAVELGELNTQPVQENERLKKVQGALELLVKHMSEKYDGSEPLHCTTTASQPKFASAAFDVKARLTTTFTEPTTKGCGPTITTIRVRYPNQIPPVGVMLKMIDSAIRQAIEETDSFGPICTEIVEIC